MKPKLQNVIMNFSGLTRMDQMEGRDFVVAPMVMLTEGVHEGSDGPLYYPPEELAKVPGVWNQKPVIVYHPQINGQGVSACAPDILTSRKVGVIMNAHFEDGKLKAEAWLEPDRMAAVDDRIAKAIENHEMMELSTGLFTEEEPTEGEWKGESYSGIARNYRPDHLALLPDKVGACSIADGAGFLRNEKGKKKSKTDAYGKMFKSYLNRRFAIALEETNVAFNELSHSDIRSALSMQLHERFGEDTFIEDTFDNFVIFENFKTRKFFQLGYMIVNDVLELSQKQPLEVVRVTEFKTVGGSPIGNAENNGKGNDMERKDAVDGLIKNGEWTEEDRDFLMKLEDSRFEIFTKNAEEAAKGAVLAENAKKEADEKAKKAEADEKAKKEAVVTANAAKDGNKIAPPKQTVDEYIANAPADIRDMLSAGITSHNAEKKKLVDAIMANERNVFTPEQLNGKGLDELKALASLAAKPNTGKAANYSGMAETILADNTEKEKPLLLPTMNFEKK